MRNRNTIKLIVILSFIMFLGIGYAVVNSVSLTITGTVSAGSENLDVYFTGTPKVSNSSKVTATSTTGSLTGTISVNNLTLNETVTATYIITNNETNVGALITPDAITNSNPDYFQVTTSVKYGDVLCPSHGTTEEVTITVKLIKTPITTSTNTTNISAKFKATPTDFERFQCPEQ